jgi:hypothetical protein
MARPVAFAVLTVALLAGCGSMDSTARPGPRTAVGAIPDERAPARALDATTESALPRTPGAPCLPPAIDPTFLQWPVLGVRPLLVVTADESMLAGAWVLYGKDDARIAVVWAGDELVVVDPHPIAGGPLWINAAMVDEQTQEILAHPTGECRWSREGEVPT